MKFEALAHALQDDELKSQIAKDLVAGGPLWSSVRYGERLGSKSLRSARFGFSGFFFAVLGWRSGFKGTKETIGDGGYFVNGRLKRFFIGLGRFVKAGDFSYELQGSGVDFVGGNRRIKIKQGFNISAHP
jgi:hypothetical protein